MRAYLAPATLVATTVSMAVSAYQSWDQRRDSQCFVAAVRIAILEAVQEAPPATRSTKTIREVVQGVCGERENRIEVSTLDGRWVVTMSPRRGDDQHELEAKLPELCNAGMGVVQIARSDGASIACLPERAQSTP